MRKPDYSQPIINIKNKQYSDWEDGEWEHMPLKHKHRIMCCDCGLVHEVTVKVVDGKIMMRMKRNDKATAAARRKKK